MSLKATLLHKTVIISALGYFVDIYDLVLFTIVRVASLKDLGVADADVLDVGVKLFNMQMIGMLIGGLIWGVLGDKRGRVSVLFGSIVLYSLANIANAFVTSTEAYGWLRLVAGIGLAGELGAAVTLVSETLPKETRGYGTSFVAGFGVSGAMLAAVVAQYFSWKVAYVVGGVLGLCLLVLRVQMFESGMFTAVKASAVSRGNFLALFKDGKRAGRYVCCILIGVPIWFVIGILIALSPELCKQLGATGPVSAGTGILFGYGGLVIGDLGTGFLSQWLRSRKKVIFGSILTTLALFLVYVHSEGGTPAYYYGMCFMMGIGAGYWALFVTVAAEQFGTNLRATVATTTPNFVRGSVVVMTLALTHLKVTYGLAPTAQWIGVATVVVALLALLGLRETFGADLDYVEESKAA